MSASVSEKRGHLHTAPVRGEFRGYSGAIPRPNGEHAPAASRILFRKSLSSFGAHLIWLRKNIFASTTSASTFCSRCGSSNRNRDQPLRNQFRPVSGRLLSRLDLRRRVAVVAGSARALHGMQLVEIRLPDIVQPAVKGLCDQIAVFVPVRLSSVCNEQRSTDVAPNVADKMLTV